jgi:hypothetical protein
MPDFRGNGTLVIAALLTLGLAFSAFWILYYVTPGEDPRTLWPWFGAAVGVILALAFVYNVRQGRDRGSR